MPSREFDEMPEKFLSEALSPSGCSDRDEVHVTNWLDLRDKAEQIGNHFGTDADYKC